MKRILLLSLCIFLFCSIYANFQITFSNDIHNSNVILVAFDANVINSRTGDINIMTNSRGIAQIGIESFDAIAERFGFTSIERMFWVKDQEWQDENGVYPMNIFKIWLENNAMIDDAFYALSRENSVIYSTFESIMTKQYIPNDPDLHLQWHIPKIRAEEMWNYTRGDTTIVIAIVDDGMKWNHEDLRANVFINHAEAPGMSINWTTGVISGGDGIDNDGNGKIDDILGWDFYYTHNQTYQSYEWMIHGTHVGGIAGAVGDNGKGISGVAMNVKMLVSKHGPSHYETALMTDPWSGILYAADTGAHIINCSWGGLANGQEGLDFSNTVIDYATAQGSIVVAAAGNSDSGSNLFIPANSRNTIAVASSDSADMKSSFSNYGNHIVITAPGSVIYSTFFWGSLEDAYDDYLALSGTSMASPLISGVVAMMLSRYPNLTVDEIKEILRESGEPMIENEAGGSYEGLLGGGRINAYKAVVREKFTSIVLNSEPDVIEHDGDGDGIINFGESVSIGLELLVRAGWGDAIGTTAEISCEIVGVEVLQGVLEFSPTIPSGTIASSLNRAIVRIDESINTREIPISVTISSNQTTQDIYPFSKTFTFIIYVSMSKVNWPLLLGGTSPSSPMVANLDGSGNRLITFASNNIHVVDVQKNYNPGFPLNIGENIMSDFAIGDVARNGNQQIVLVTNNGRVLVVSHTAEILYEYHVGNNVRINPIIADLNNDGFYEIIVGTQNGSLFVFNGNDLSLWENYPLQIGNNILVNMAVGDINGDGTLNIVINYGAGQNQGIHVINPVTAQNIAGYPLTEIGSSLQGATLVNFSGGNGLDIVFAGMQTSNCPITILGSDGTVIRQTTVPSAIRTELAVIDLFNDGIPYIIFGDAPGNIWVKNALLEDVHGFPLNVGARIESSPVFADFDGDGNREIIFGDDEGRIHILRPNGQYVPGYPLKISNTSIRQSPWVGSFDEGRGDVLLVVSNGIEYIDTKRKVNIPAWNTFRGNLGKTASFSDPRTPETEIIAPLIINSLSQNYPNPFNPETTIKFSMSRDDNIRLTIFNIRGQIVRVLVNEFLDAGEHEVIWNGNDTNNIRVASGLYFYRMDIEGFSQVRRMVLLK